MRIKDKSSWFRAGAVVATGALALAMTGCTAEVHTARPVVEYDEPVVEVQAAPVRVESYPRYTYRGRDVYLVDGRWYSRRGGRWVVYREEPRELARYRTQVRGRVYYG